MGSVVAETFLRGGGGRGGTGGSVVDLKAVCGGDIDK